MLQSGWQGRPVASQRHEDRSGFAFKIPGWADSIAAQPRTGNGGALPLSLLTQ